MTYRHFRPCSLLCCRRVNRSADDIRRVSSKSPAKATSRATAASRLRRSIPLIQLPHKLEYKTRSSNPGFVSSGIWNLVLCAKGGLILLVGVFRVVG